MKSFYNWNTDKTIRAEIVISNRLTPFEWLTDSMKWNFLEYFTWEKDDLRGLIFDTQYIDCDGRKCDDQGNPVEDESFHLIPGKRPYTWRQRICISKSDLTLALSTEEYNSLIRCCPDAYMHLIQSDFREVKCMELYPKESGPCVDFSWPVYVGTESISTLQQMVFEDIQCGDINERYRYEYRHNEEFAKKFGTTVKAGLAKFQDDLDASRRAMFFNCKPIICSSKTTGEATAVEGER